MTEENKVNGHGIALDFSATTAADAPQFNGAEILERVSRFIRKFVHLSDAQARIVTVWVAHTYAMSSWTTTPYLAITSAVKQSGKTRLLEVLELLVNKPWLTGRVTAACLVRKVDQVRPTLLLDESDAAFQGEKEYAEALRGILNTGFYSGGVASCCIGQGANITYKDFKTYCAKAIAGIGQLPDTVHDRSIPIRLERKKHGDAVARFRRRHAKLEAAEVKEPLEGWMTDVAARLKEAEPNLPDKLSDRQQDGIEPLLTIADEAHEDWPVAVRDAALQIFRSAAADDQNVGVQLLADIRTIFDESGERIIFTTELLSKLKDVDSSPWADWAKGRGLTPHGLSRMLRPFDIAPGNVRRGDVVTKGYDRDRFKDAFSRYLPAHFSRSDFQSATSPQPASTQEKTSLFDPLREPSVAVCKSGSDPHKHSECSDVADQNPVREGVDTHKRSRPNPGERLCSKHGFHSEWIFDADGKHCLRCGDPHPTQSFRKCQ